MSFQSSVLAQFVSVPRGLLAMTLACLLFSIMNATVYAIVEIDPAIPASVISFARIFCNLLILLLPALNRGKVLALFGDLRLSLWLRGLFGATALMLSFAAITRLGPGETAFLTATSGVFVALLSPLVLGQKHSVLGWLAIVGSFSGVSLLFGPVEMQGDLLGRGMALASALLSALAYLMVARAGRSNSPASVIFYFCLMALGLHLLYFAVYGFYWPQLPLIWGLLLLTGIVGSGAQFCLTYAYQSAPAARVSAVAYLVPVLSLLWGGILFDLLPGVRVLIGAGLILVFGLLLPFVGRSR